MRTVIALNELEPADVASVIFTTTPDLTATFPALAARDIGWTEVPLLCAHEMAVPGSLQKCVRVMIHVNTTRTAAEIRHVYLKGARELRPEWAYSDDDIAEQAETGSLHEQTREPAGDGADDAGDDNCCQHDFPPRVIKPRKIA